MREVIWIGDERIIPGIGLGQPNQPIKLKEDLIKDFKQQGLVKEVTAQKAKTIKPIEQEDE